MFCDSKYSRIFRPWDVSDAQDSTISTTTNCDGEQEESDKSSQIKSNDDLEIKSNQELEIKSYNDLGIKSTNESEIKAYNKPEIKAYNESEDEAYNESGSEAYNEFGSEAYNESGSETYNKSEMTSYKESKSKSYNKPEKNSYKLEVKSHSIPKRPLLEDEDETFSEPIWKKRPKIDQIEPSSLITPITSSFNPKDFLSSKDFIKQSNDNEKRYKSAEGSSRFDETKLHNLAKIELQNPEPEENYCVPRVPSLPDFPAVFPSTNFGDRYPIYPDILAQSIGLAPTDPLFLESLAQGYPLEEYSRVLTQEHQAKLLNSKKQRLKKYRCPHCDVAFSNNGQLKGHIRIHTGERPFKCDEKNCGKTFTRNEELTRHKKIHSGLRPFPCTHCGKRFGRKDHLKKHSRTHFQTRDMYAVPVILPLESWTSIAASSSSGFPCIPMFGY